MRPVRTALVLLALAGAAGCPLVRPVAVTQRGPINVDLRGVAIELAPDVGGDMAEGGEGPDSAELRSGGTTVGIQGPDMQLAVNGRPYGPVQKGDRVLVEKGKVSVNGAVRQPQDRTKEN
jgi:hypothetical protein